MNKKVVFSVIILLAILMSILTGCNGEDISVQFMVDDTIYFEFNTKGKEPLEIPANPTKEGFVFDGWFLDKDIWNESLTVDYLLERKLEENLIVYSKWLENEYTISFDSNGGTEIPSITQVSASALSEPTPPTKDGYTFEGWYLDIELQTEYDFTTMPSENIELYASWEINEYTIAFYSNGGPAIESITQEYNTEVNPPSKVGYVFTGWYSDIALETPYVFSTMPSGNTAIYFTWDVESYTLTLSKNISAAGTVSGGGLTEYNSDVIITASSNPGYPWLGWYDGETKVSTGSNLTYSFKMPASNRAYEARWDTNVFSISFQVNGGPYVHPITQTYGTSVSAPTAPIFEGYTFVGWYSDIALQNAYSFTTMPAENTTVYAKWDANPYTISFEENGGSVVQSITQDYGTSVNTPTAPTYNGYTFIGWYSDIALQNAYSFTTMPAENMTIYAKWDANPYTISFESNEGSTVVAITQDFATEVSSPVPPTKDGYSFAGWYADIALQNAYVFTTMPSENITLYAKWNANQHTISFDSNEGTAVSSITQDFGTEVSSPVPPTKDGYSFAGWYSDIALQNAYVFTTMPAENIILYASWSVGDYSIVLTKNILNAGSVLGEGAKEFNSEVTITANSNIGYTWLGWYEGETKVSTDVSLTYTFIMPASNKSFEARWEINEYTISFFSDGGSTVESITQNYASSVTEPSDPTKTGYSFVRWCSDTELQIEFVFSTMPAENITIYAKWSINQYTISFQTNGGSDVQSITQDYATDVIKPSNPIYEGYSFDEWYTAQSEEYIFSTMPAENITLYANWENNFYTITLTKNISVAGAVSGGGSKEFNSDVTISATTNEGYTWLGWYEGETKVSIDSSLSYDFTVPSTDKTFEAKWEINEYTISFESNEGSAVSAITQDFGTSVSEPTAPTKLGNIFIDWCSDISLETVYTFTTMPAENITLYALWEEVYTRSGSYLWFGEYPQTIASSSAVSAMGTTPDASGYYTSTFDNQRYAKVVASPFGSGYNFSDSTAITASQTYYFKVEPIKWRILSENEGEAVILCESIIEQERFDDSSNNYADSEIRAWLNNQFYNTAFNTLQRSFIQTTEVDNSVYSTGHDPNTYACANTNDKIYLPSYRDVINTDYGFSGSSSADVSREKFTSDYSRAIGVAFINSGDYIGDGMWMLRSPVPDYSTDNSSIFYDGTIYSYESYRIDIGIAPALTINLG